MCILSQFQKLLSQVKGSLKHENNSQFKTINLIKCNNTHKAIEVVICSKIGKEIDKGKLESKKALKIEKNG
jgi:hypothetical protein